MGVPKGSRLQDFPQIKGPGHAGDAGAAALIEGDATITSAVIIRNAADAMVARVTDGVLMELLRGLQCGR